MAVSIHELFEEFDIECSKAFKWKEKLNIDFNGIYVVALTNDPKSQRAHSYSLKICDDTFNDWKSLAKDLEVGGSKVECKEDIEKHLLKFWNPNENILYIGQSTSKTNTIGKRVNQYYTHKVGQRGPHTGGYWLKLLDCLNDVHVFCGKATYPLETEFKMLLKFAELSSGRSFFDLENIATHLPFANIKVDIAKHHTLKKHYKVKKRS